MASYTLEADMLRKAIACLGKKEIEKRLKKEVEGHGINNK